MHLKRLQLIGFKTFAERTEIEFSPGVTAIVGPNGSGKSNIADAILWALGEQRASAIRGAKLQDVIFAGSALRKATGLAEVSLTVDNSDGSLPLAYDEVTITRRAYRNGEGEFSINKTPCRLRDIHELFLDTGVGRESYALVNQSEVDAVLSADPQARRPLFEEAAGIHKFRVRKREALRKLEQTEANLVRVRDIVREIERQLGPLERQAEVAVRYNQTRERLESLERNFLIAEVRGLEDELVRIRAERDAASALAEQTGRLSRHADDHLSALAQTLAEVDSALDGIRARHQAALSHVERVRSDRALAEQRGQGLAAQVDLLRAEIDDLEGRRETAALALRDNAGSSRDAGEQSVAATAQIETLESQRRELAPRIAHLRRAEEQRIVRIAERERRRATREAQGAAASARVAQLESQARDLESRVAASEERLKRTSAEQAAAQAQQISAAASVAGAESAAQVADSLVQQRREELAAAQSERAAQQAQMASLRARLQTLQELEAAQEGYFSGVRAVLQAVQRGRLTGQYTLVADAMRAPEGFDLAFDVALGGAVQDIIVATEQEAKTAIEMLKRDRAGRATFLPISRVRGGGQRPSVPGGQPGYLGCAADLATFDQRFDSVMEMLLGRVLIAADVDSAIGIADSARGWGKVVTIAGEVLLPTGAVTGGSAQKQTGSLLHRKTEIAALTERCSSGERAAGAADRALDTAQSALRAALDAQTAASSERGRSHADLNRAERALDNASREFERLSRELGDAQARLVLVRDERDQAQRQQRDQQAALESSSDGDDAPSNDADAADGALLPSLLDSDQRLQEELMQLRIRLASAQEKLRGDQTARRNAESEIERVEMQLVRRRERLEALVDEGETLAARSGDLAANSADAAAHLESVHAELDAKQAERHAVARDAREAQMRARRLADERNEAQSRAQAAEVRETRLQMQQSQSAARLLEEYDATVADALSLAETPPIAPDTPREVARLRREMRAFGEVNAHAAAEYAELRGRYDDMTGQQQDAELAKEKVLVAIREIDDSTRGLFMASFHQVAVAFEEIFQRLMGGGHTELSLTDPDNLLETGVEIAVQAPGKKKQNLMLLSGGERALTAVALLFAFLKVRPAPFCVMDEVDAPLDGVNVERFANLLRDFGRTGQFLVITHNPSTMEAARSWYGVTMQEPGVSRVLSMEAPVDADPTRATMEPMAAVYEPAGAVA